jgi:hypothetical protein
MLCLGHPFRRDACWWALTSERPNRQHCDPHGNKNKKSSLLPSSRIATVSHPFLGQLSTSASPQLAPPRPCCCARASPPAFLSPHCHSPLATEFFKPTRRGPRQLLRRGVLHHAQRLVCRPPPSPLHLSTACRLSQFPTK